jgi:hypothetical protein
MIKIIDFFFFKKIMQIVFNIILYIILYLKKKHKRKVFLLFLKSLNNINFKILPIVIKKIKKQTI